MRESQTSSGAEERRLIVLSELGETLSLAVVKALYAYNGSVDVLVAATAETTVALLEHYRVATLAISAEATGGSGLLSARDAHNRDSGMQVITVASETSPRQANLRYANGTSLIVDGRNAEKLANVLWDSRRWTEVLHGTLTDLNPVDVLQALCLAQRSLTMRLTGTDHSAVVWLVSGEIRHVVWNDLDGLPALSHVLAMTTGTFSAFSGMPLPTISVGLPWQAALMEAARISDERESARDGGARQGRTRRPTADLPLVMGGPNGDSGLARLPSSNDTPTPLRTPIVESSNPDYAELTQLGLQSLRAGDLAQARAYWAAARAWQPRGRDDKEALDLESETTDVRTHDVG